MKFRATHVRHFEDDDVVHFVAPWYCFALFVQNSSNRVGPAGAGGVAAALARSPSLQELHLSGNALGDEGVTALVKGAVDGRRLRGNRKQSTSS